MINEDNVFSLPSIIKEDASFTLTQSNELLYSIMMGCSTPAKYLLSYFFYYISNNTSSIIEQLGGYDAWDAPNNDMIKYDIDLSPFYEIPYIKEHYKDVGKNSLTKLFKAAAKELIGEPLTLVNELGQERAIVGVISKADIDEDTGEICSITASRDIVSLLVPELIERRDIAEAHLLSIVQTFGFSSKYSERVYTYINGKIQAADYKGSFRCPIQVLKKMLLVSEEKAISENKKFIQKVLKKAVDDINNVSDLNVTFTPIKDGRYYKWIEFTASRKGENVVVEMATPDENNIPVALGETDTNQQTTTESKGPVNDQNDSMLFYTEAEKDGFSATQVLSLYNHFNGNIEGLYTARAAYQAVVRMGIAEVENKYDFYMTVSAPGRNNI